MDLVQLQKSIKNNELGNLYVFTGENIGLQNIYISKFPNVVRATDIESIKCRLTTKDIFSKEEYTYVIRDDKDFFQKKDNIELLKDFKYNKVILLYTETDKRSTWYKELTDYIVDFKQMTRKQLAKIIADEVDVRDEKFIDAIIDRCNFDYSQVMNTCEQLNLVSGRYTMSLLDSICPPPVEANVFAMNTYIMKGSKQCYYELESLIALGEPVMRILGALTKGIDDTAKCLKFDAKYCEEVLGIKAWIWKTKRNDCKLSLDKLTQIAVLLNKCKDLILKGVLPDVLAIKYTVLEIIKIF